MTNRVLTLLTLFALAMGYLEAACVVSLKQLYFPEGYHAPFHAIPATALLLEQWREVATLVMIGGVALLRSSGIREFLARGLWVFGVWDLTYYVFLRFLTGFPARLSDLDIAFLVPGPWVLPVWVPVAASTACLLVALLLGGRRGR
jgi:hypothetical protein